MSTYLGSRPVFIGRLDEIAQLRAALDSARSGKGGLVLLSGPPGIGKSSLASEFIEALMDSLASSHDFGLREMARQLND